MSSSWDPVRVKAQLRLTAQRLGQLQDRKDSSAHVTGRDIATLLGQRNVSLARAKAHKLIQEEAVSNVMEILEMYCGVILERFADLEKDTLNLHPATVEAVASIIYAAAFTESQDLNLVRDMFIYRIGPEFSQSAIHNRDGHVSQRILNCMHRKPSAADVDERLQKIAHTFNVNWRPQMRLEEKISALSEILDASDIIGTVDIQKLRLIASTGLPVNPPWLRPRVWKLLLGTVPVTKIHWEIEAQKKREGYYDLIRRLLVNVASLPTPVSPPSPADKSLLGLVDSLTMVPAYLYHGLEDEAEQSTICPVHDIAPAAIKIDFASSLDARLQLIQNESSADGEKDTSFSSTPEIRLDFEDVPSSPQGDTFDLSSAAQKQQPTQKTLSLSNHLSPKVFRAIAAHPSHVSTLLRLLYVHRSLVPGIESPNIASLLVPLYAVMNQEAEPTEVAHVEADTFWLFEALLKEVSELEEGEGEGGLVWMKKFRERLSVVDNELLEDLVLKGLDPGLPQYSYRWLSPMLTHTLPLPAALMAWDAVFSQPEFSRQSNPKLEHLLDICTAMLVRARARLLLLGKNAPKSPSLWDVDASGIERQPLKPWELGDAFMEGMTLLQRYPIEEAGGIERVLQVAGDVLIQRVELAKQPETGTVSLGTKIRDTVWRGFTNQTMSADNSPEDTEEEDTETENEANYNQADSKNANDSSSSGTSGWASYLRSTVIRGITNQSAMEVPPSPNSLSPSPSPSRMTSREPSPSRSSTLHSVPEQNDEQTYELSSPPSTSSSLWNYAEKLKQSDMAAKLSKVSTNFSAKALDVWSARNAPANDVPATGGQRHLSKTGNTLLTNSMIGGSAMEDHRQGTISVTDHSNGYSPPPRPAFFKPPRDTRIFTTEEMTSLAIPDSPESVNSSLSTPSAHSRVESLTSSLPSWTGLLPITPKSTKTGPRPLLLKASSLVTPTTVSQVSRSENSTPIPNNNQWSEVLRSKAQSSPRHRDSQVSQTSVSSRHSNPSSSSKAGAGGWDSDTSVSRVVPLNRASMSPMAPVFRASRMHRNASASSQSEFGVLSPKAPSESSPREGAHGGGSRGSLGWERTPIPDSPSTGPSSPPPRTPVTNGSIAQTSIRITIPDQQRGSVVLAEPSVPALDPVPQSSKKSHRKVPSPITLVPAGDTSDSSIPSTSPLNRIAPRVRSKRYGPQARQSSLREREPATGSAVGQTQPMPVPSPRTLAAPDPDTDLDVATTPKAAHFPSTSPTDGCARSPRRRKISMEGHERRRKISGESSSTRTRKVSGESKPVRTRKVSGEGIHKRDSIADDGDDEGYDELLSAYESEEGSKDDHKWSSEA
ncbi:hypothetical protein M0805_003110 [Coniferiporia weirii]|nr:hypothetical protein M0805_003110 [Coniferiporia weirii]